MIETIVDSIRISLSSNSRVVFLREVHGDRHLPIWIGEYEAGGIAMELQGNPSPRPLSWDLLKSLVAEINGTIERVVVTDLSQDIFFARIVVSLNGRTIEIDSRASDAIALAVRARCPILVDDMVMERAGILADDDDDDDQEIESISAAQEQETATGTREDDLGIFRDFINTLNLDDFEKRRGN